MSDPYYVYFENAKTKIDFDFFSRIAKWLMSKSFEYSSLWVAGDEIEASLEDAVQRLSGGGQITFVRGHNDLNLYYGRQVAVISHPANFADLSFTDLFIDVVAHLYSELRAERAYGTPAIYGYSREQQAAIRSETYISWINIFSPETVRRIGKQRLLQMQEGIKNPLKEGSFVRPYQATNLDGGSFLLVLTSNPSDASEAMRQRLSEVLFPDSTK